MKVFDNSIKIPVERDGEFVGEIKFNPDDVSFVESFYGLISNLEEKERGLRKEDEQLKQNSEIDNYGLPMNLKDRLELTKELCRFMRGEIDKVFGVGTSQMIFEEFNSPNMFEQFFDEIAPHIQAARNEKMEKYINRAQHREGNKKVMK